MTPSDTTLFVRSLQGFTRTLTQLDRYLTGRAGWTVVQRRDANPGCGSLSVVLRRDRDRTHFLAVFTSGDGGAGWVFAGDLLPLPDGYVAPE